MTFAVHRGAIFGLEHVAAPPVTRRTTTRPQQSAA
jgi:hypothetical protein